MRKLISKLLPLAFIAGLIMSAFFAFAQHAPISPTPVDHGDVAVLAAGFGLGGGIGSQSAPAFTGSYTTWTGANGQTLTTTTTGEFTTSSRIRSDSGFRIGGILVDLTTAGLTFGVSGTPTISATGAATPTMTFKAKTGNGAGTASFDFQTGTTSIMKVYGAGALAPVPASTLAISGTPDTTRAPMDSGTACRISAAAASQTWRPSETNAVDGAYVCCTNTGANSITMSESVGVYEGPASASVVGTFDTVCMEYVVDRWVQRSFTDN